MKMLKCFDGTEMSERELAAINVPTDMLPLTLEEREEYSRVQRRIETSRNLPWHSEALQEAAEFILRVIVPYRLAMEGEARQIDQAEMAQQAR